MPSVATWMNPETVIPSEVSETEKEKDCYGILFLWNLKVNDANELTYKTERDSQSQRVDLWLPRERRDTQGVWDGHDHTAIFKMDHEDLLDSTWNSAQCYVAAWMGEGFGGE